MHADDNSTISKRLTNLAKKLQKMQIDHVLLSSAASLRYFAGVTSSIETGPSPFTPLAGVLLSLRGERPNLLLAESESNEGIMPGLGLEPFTSYSFEHPLRATAELSGKLLQHLKPLSPGKVGIEHCDLPVAILDRLRAECPRLEFIDVSPAVAELRMVKDAEEIEQIKESIDLCDLGQETAKKSLQPGMSELELFQEVRKAMEAKAGCRLPTMVDLVSGDRSALVGGPPSPRRIQAGDPVLIDIVVQHQGYWGDSCNTLVLGGPTREFSMAFKGVATALQAGIESIKPGVRACDIDSVVRKVVGSLGAEYPHHSGHGIGVTYHEGPRIVPYETIPLQENMVIALEPGIYFEGRWGLRLEHVVRVTKTGAEVLSNFQHGGLSGP
jgi:Xaa-Pro aminopeptidase